jgi:hypothetical protein
MGNVNLVDPPLMIQFGIVVIWRVCFVGEGFALPLCLHLVGFFCVNS